MAVGAREVITVTNAGENNDVIPDIIICHFQHFLALLA
jgi:hypothetical protein